MLTFQQIGYMGRLGNQMFQFASTLGVSNRLGFEARFPIENCLNYQGSGPFDPSIGVTIVCCNFISNLSNSLSL